MATVSGKQGTRFTNGTELVGGLRPQTLNCQRGALWLWGKPLSYPGLAGAKNEKKPYARHADNRISMLEGIGFFLSFFAFLPAQIRRFRQMTPHKNIEIVLDVVKVCECWLDLFKLIFFFFVLFTERVILRRQFFQ